MAGHVLMSPEDLRREASKAFSRGRERWEKGYHCLQPTIGSKNPNILARQVQKVIRALPQMIEKETSHEEDNICVMQIHPQEYDRSLNIHGLAAAVYEFCLEAGLFPCVDIGDNNKLSLWIDLAEFYLQERESS